MNQSLINSYVEYLRKMGYSASTIHAYSKALEQAPDTWDTNVPGELYEHIINTLKLKQEYFLPAARHNIKPASSLLFMFVTGTSFKAYTKQEIQSQSAYVGVLKEFYVYSTEFKHLTPMAAEAEKHHISEFLNSIGNCPDDWAEMTAENIRDYVCSRFSHLKASSIGRYVTSLRNFFRFLEYKGIPVSPSVFNLPLAPAAWGKSNVPAILSPDEEMRLRNHYKGTDGISRRNNIIILLMLDLGLRCAEISNLHMDDIHWNKGVLSLGRTKNQHDRQLPISCGLGMLLEDYIMNHRPSATDGHLFLRSAVNNQYTAMSRESVRSVVRWAFEKESIQGWWKGTHALRRTAASKIYNTGNGLKMTADLLGHESLDSTKQYIKVDFRQLSEVAPTWPGGDPDE
ncbi:MAG: tyrosine-type recombinase/integrase [Acetatifactor sp.]|nr:tyrosine-type recombinase/integrase [Acetatifactor sp.]